MSSSTTRKALVLALALSLGASACGGSIARVRAASAQVAHVDWHEVSRYPGVSGTIAFSVRRIRIGRRGWTVHGAFSNRTSKTLTILVPEGGHTGEGLGLLVTRTRSMAGLPPRALPALVAQTSAPPVPIAFRPGQRRSLSFSGSQAIPRGRYVRVVVSPLAAVPGGKEQLVTTHSYRVR